MQAMGIDTAAIAPVVVAFAGRVGKRRSIFTGRYIVTLPRRGGNRTEMDAGYRETKHALTRYLLNTNARGKWTLTLQLMWTKQMPEWFRKNIKPEQLGLVDHGSTFGWHDDAVHLMAEVMAARLQGDSPEVHTRGVQARPCR